MYTTSHIVTPEKIVNILRLNKNKMREWLGWGRGGGGGGGGGGGVSEKTVYLYGFELS
jgi:hypothetical protein